MQERFPDFSGMARITMETGKRTGHILVIMPFHNKYDYLDKHLELLNRQTFMGFDLIIVGSSGSDEKLIEKAVSGKKPGFHVIVAKRHEDNGAAGGFYTGERFALENGYGAIIMAEEDALPIDARLIEALVGQSEKGSQVVAPVCSFMMGNSVVFRASGVHFYTLIKKDALPKAGLHYVPIYLGAEDMEFSNRLPKAVQINASLTHPAWLSVFTNFERNVGYRVNNTIFTCPQDLVNYVYTFGALLPAYLVFGISLTRAAGAHILVSILRMKYGKNAVFGKGKMAIEQDGKFDCAVTPIDIPACKSPCYNLGKTGMLSQLLQLPAFVLRKKVLFYPVKNHALFMGMVFARETWVATSSGHYLLAENRNPALHLLKMLAFILLSPLMLLVGLLAWPTLVFRRPETKGFGISDFCKQE